MDAAAKRWAEMCKTLRAGTPLERKFVPHGFAPRVNLPQFGEVQDQAARAEVATAQRHADAFISNRDRSAAARRIDNQGNARGRAHGAQSAA